MSAKISTTCTLYKKTSLTEDKRLVLDNIETFLATKTSSTPTGSIQLPEEAFDNMEVRIKLAYVPSNLIDGVNGGWDYMKLYFARTGIGPTQASTYYYFIRSLRWLSTGALEVVGRLDALNSILPQLEFEHCTTTRRRHFDRFKNYSAGAALRLVHRFDEGLSPVQYQSSKIILNETNQATVQWNLVYRNTNLPDPDQYHQINPVETHLTTDADTDVEIESAGGVLTAASFTGTASYYYFFMGTGLTGSTITGGGITQSIDDDTAVYCIFVAADGTLVLMDTLALIPSRYEPRNVILSDEILTLGGPMPDTLDFENNDYTTGSVVEPVAENYHVPLSSTVAILAGVHGSYDRTDSRLIKITKIPYSPVAVTYSGGAFNIPSDWVYDGDCNDLKAQDINKRFHRTITFTLSSPTQNPLYSDMIVAFTPAAGMTRSIDYESKLLHSAFHTVKFAYDSFSVTLPYEDMGHRSKTYYATYVKQYEIKVDYTISTTMSGKFMFEFSDYAGLLKVTEDFPLVIAVARNNEEPIFSSAYVNYLRTGYNYDVKAKELTKASSAVSIAGSAAAGLASGAMTGSVARAAIGAAIGAVVGAIRAAISQQSAENALQQKITQAKAQAVSIQGSDDVDLMLQYAKNRLYVLTYDPSPEMREALFNLFYFYGYACNETGVPTHDNRYYFDFLQCDAAFTRDTARSFSPYFIEDVTAKLSEGVTFLHAPLCSAGVLETTYENWEASLLS